MHNKWTDVFRYITMEKTILYLNESYIKNKKRQLQQQLFYVRDAA
jgi:hypothetical protein